MFEHSNTKAGRAKRLWFLLQPTKHETLVTWEAWNFVPFTPGNVLQVCRDCKEIVATVTSTDVQARATGFE